MAGKSRDRAPDGFAAITAIPKPTGPSASPARLIAPERRRRAGARLSGRVAGFVRAQVQLGLAADVVGTSERRLRRFLAGPARHNIAPGPAARLRRHHRHHEADDAIHSRLGAITSLNAPVTRSFLASA